MKKLTVFITTTLLLLIFIPGQSTAGTEPGKSSMAEPKSAEATKAGILLTRLYQIDAMDKSELSSSERSQMRREVRSIRNQLKELESGVYLSVGAIIIIILLLILLV